MVCLTVINSKVFKLRKAPFSHAELTCLSIMADIHQNMSIGKWHTHSMSSTFCSADT